jgi:hypothetical protein
VCGWGVGGGVAEEGVVVHIIEYPLYILCLLTATKEKIFACRIEGKIVKNISDNDRILLFYCTYNVFYIGQGADWLIGWTFLYQILFCQKTTKTEFCHPFDFQYQTTYMLF